MPRKPFIPPTITFLPIEPEHPLTTSNTAEVTFNTTLLPAWKDSLELEF